MNLRTLLLKETRPLLAPWCVITLAGVLTNLISPIGFWVVLPLLATLSFGHEFQHRTLSLLLSQPIDRMKIWNIKWILASSLSVVSAAVFYAVERRHSLHGDFTTVIAGAWVLVVISSAPFWTLVARSTIGGLAINNLQAGIIAFALTVVDSLRIAGSPSSTIRSVLSLAIPIALVYSGVMIWLGRRKFARFQATGTLPSDDALVNHPLLSRAFTKWLTCRPNGAVLNLLRKEVRLLWPIWLFTILCVIGLAALWPLQFLVGSSSSSTISIPSMAMLIVAAYGFGTLLLTGSTSVGEEKALGARPWQLTLPVSTNLQWFVKLTTVVIVTAVGLVTVVSVATWLFGNPFVLVFDSIVGRHGLAQLLGFAVLSIFAFWTACAVNGTVRAVLWAIPAAVAINWAYRLAEMTVLVFQEFGVFHLAAVTYHRISFNYDLYGLLMHKWHDFPAMLMLGIPLLYVFLESRRLFRKEMDDNFVRTLRTLLRPAMLLFLLSFSLLTFRVFAVETWNEAMKAFSQAHQDIQRLGLDLTNTDATHPRELTPSEVERVVTTTSVRRWLDTPRIFVFRGSPSGVPKNNPKAVTSIYELSDGLRCTTTDLFSARPNGAVVNVPLRGWTNCKDPRGYDVSPWR